MEHKEYTERYRPLSPWAYVGLTVLFSIPVVGLVFLIVYSINGSNINRRNYARSYWCTLLIGLCFIGLVFLFCMIMGYSMPDMAQILQH